MNNRIKTIGKGVAYMLLAMLVMPFVVYAQDGKTLAQEFSSMGEAKSYRFVKKNSSVYACEAFIETFVDSKYSDKINEIYDRQFYIKAYDTATRDFDVAELKQYVTRFPEGEYLTKAKEAIDVISWQNAKNDNTKQAYEKYIKEFPNGKALQMAKKALSGF
ncbi:MAG: hypothetical protein ACK5IQ_04060 [Bacteroidales bacterium]